MRINIRKAKSNEKIVRRGSKNMSLFNNENGMMDVIRCDEQDYLIWKWKPYGNTYNQTNKENSIRWGSSLRVKDGSVAVFVYKQKDGVFQDYIEGPFDQIIKTENLPVITNIIGLAYDGKSPFQAEVYFINLAKIVQVRFAVPFFDIYDPRFVDFSVPVAVRGVLTFNISDYKAFIKLHRLDIFDLETFKEQIKDVLTKYIKSYVSGYPVNNNMSVLQLERQLPDINEVCEKNIRNELEKDFGVNISRVDISDIEINKESEGYLQLKSVTQDVTTATIKIQTEAKLKNIQAEQKDYEEQLRIRREEGQYAQHLQSQTQNIGAYQTEKQAEVGVAGAEALGKMGANGATNIDLGNGNVGGNGMNMAGIVAGMAMGGAIGQNMAGMFNNMNQGINTPNITPPPMTQTIYFMALQNGQYAQYDINGLKNNIAQGLLTKDTLIWKQGLPNWVKATEVAEVNALFDGGIVPPEMP